MSKEVTVECEACDGVFIAKVESDLLKTLFGHEVQCIYCAVWCDIKLPEDDEFNPDD